MTDLGELKVPIVGPCPICDDEVREMAIRPQIHSSEQVADALQVRIAAGDSATLYPCGHSIPLLGS